MKVRKRLTISFLIVTLSYCVVHFLVNTSAGEIHYIPSGYEGVVEIVFDVKDGSPAKYENGNRVYKIPQSGKLETQEKFNESWILSKNLKYFYQNYSSELMEIKYSDEASGLTKDSVLVFSRSVARESEKPHSEKVVYVVGKFKNKDDLIKKKYGFY